MENARAPLLGAVIGCGFVSQFHLAAWPRVPSARIAALCDRDAARLSAAGALVPEARRYRDAATMFEREPSLDFVEICTLPESHRELVELAARRGAHVLCQKPAALDRPEFEALIDICARAGTRLMVHENWRFRPWYRAMRGAIDAGRVGRPLRLRIAHRDARAVRSNGFADQPYLATMLRLVLMDVGCHLFDTARYLLGEVAAVTATTGRLSGRTVGEDVAHVVLHFASGALGVCDISWCAPPDQARPEWALHPTTIEGTEAALQLRTDGNLDLLFPDGRRELVPVPLPPADQVYNDGYAAVQRHFIDGLISGTDHETRGEANLKTMDIVWTAYRSAEERRTISLEPGKPSNRA